MSQLTTNNSETNQPQREVDLIELSSAFFKWLKSLCCSIWNFLIDCTIYLIRKSPWLVPIVVAGAVISWGTAVRKPKFYASSAIIKSNSVETSLIMENLKTLDFLFSNMKHAELATMLDLSADEAVHIKSLTGYYGVMYKGSTSHFPTQWVTKPNSRDTLLLLSPYFKVTVHVDNENVYPVLSKALVDYVNSHPFWQPSNVLRIEQTKEQIVHTDREIAALQHVLESYNTAGQQIIIPMMSGEKQQSEVVQIREALAVLYWRKGELERNSVLFTNPITVIEDFSKSFSLVDRTPYCLLSGAVYAFVLGVIVLLLWDNRKKIVAAVREKE